MGVRMLYGGNSYEEINYSEVTTFADLPDADENTGVIYIVKTATGVWGINRKRAGFYRSDGASWGYLGVAPTLADLGGASQADFDTHEGNGDIHHNESHNAVSHSDIASSGADIDDAVSKKHSNAQDHSNAADHAQGTDQGLDNGGGNAVTAAEAKAGYDHSQVAHAPSDAEKNSDISKAEIEAKLTGELSSHSHAGGGALAYTELDGSVNTTADTLGLNDGAWGEWDLSGTLPVGTAAASIAINKKVATDSVGVRADGSALARSMPALKLEVVVVSVKVVASRKIEIMSGDVSDADTFSLIGYWS